MTSMPLPEMKTDKKCEYVFAGGKKGHPCQDPAYSQMTISLHSKKKIWVCPWCMIRVKERHKKELKKEMGAKAYNEMVKKRRAEIRAQYLKTSPWYSDRR